jgi:hypothetical protein
MVMKEANGGWKIEDGWKIKDERWRIEDCRSSVNSRSSIFYPLGSFQGEE